MTFENFKLMLQQDVQRTDKEGVWYPIWINRALRRLQSDASWSCMRSPAILTIPVGETLAELPANYKELTPEVGAISLIDPAFPKRPSRYFCDVVSLEDMAAGRYSGSCPVWVGQTDGVWGVNLMSEASQTLTLRAYYYGFLPDLVEDGDFNYLTVNYPELVEAKIKEIAFGAITDPVALQYRAAVADLLPPAIVDDKRRAGRGRVIRMGG